MPHDPCDWQQALARPTAFVMPLTSNLSAHGMAMQRWLYPHTLLERRQFAVFEDLHRSG